MHFYIVIDDGPSYEIIMNGILTGLVIQICISNLCNLEFWWIRIVLSGPGYGTPTTLYDGNYVFVNIQKWIFIFSADELVPRFISFNDFQWILTENLYEKDKFSNILNFFSQRIIETGCQVSMSHVTSRDTTRVTPRYKTKYNRIISPTRRPTRR